MYLGVIELQGLIDQDMLIMQQWSGLYNNSETYTSNSKVFPQRKFGQILCIILFKDIYENCYLFEKLDTNEVQEKQVENAS